MTIPKTCIPAMQQACLPRQCLLWLAICFLPALAIRADEPKSAEPNTGSVTIKLKLLPANQTQSTEQSAKPDAAKQGEPKQGAAASASTKPSGSVDIVLSAPQRAAPKSSSKEDELPSTAQISAEPGLAEQNLISLDSKKVPSTSKLTKNRGGDPGDPGDGDVKPLPSLPDDLPLVQNAYPVDIPEAKASAGEMRYRPKPSDSRDAPAQSQVERERQRRIEQLLDYYRTNLENVVQRGPWALMHTILPYGVETQIIAGKTRVNAVGWLCHNGIAAKQRMFQPTRTGFRTNVGAGVQGHEGQFLAILAQSHVQSDYPIQVGNRRYTIRDLVNYEMATCREKTELTFKLIGFSHYLRPETTWRDNRGRPWSMEKLVSEELAQPINGEACGGTHRLMGLACAVISRQEAGLPITGQFQRAEKFLNDFVEYTLTLQNADGSFSTEWFERRAEEPDLERKVQTTGHILEWLVYTLPDEHLSSPEIANAVDFLLDTIGNEPGRKWPIGPRGHSLRALSLYYQRVYRNQPLTPSTKFVAQPEVKSFRR